MKNACRGNRWKSSSYLEFEKICSKTVLNILSQKKKCRFCGLIFKSETRFKATPPFLWVQTNAKQSFSISDIPKILKIDSYSYRFVCLNFKSSFNHFKSLFYLNDIFYQIDDRNTKVLLVIKRLHGIDSCFYCLE